jgi:hypothetical protein
MEKRKGDNMKSNRLTCITTMTLFAALAIPVRLAAQERDEACQDGTTGTSAVTQSIRVAVLDFTVVLLCRYFVGFNPLVVHPRERD